MPRSNPARWAGRHPSHCVHDDGLCAPTDFTAGIFSSPRRAIGLTAAAEKGHSK